MPSFLLLIINNYMPLLNNIPSTPSNLKQTILCLGKSGSGDSLGKIISTFLSTAKTKAIAYLTQAGQTLIAGVESNIDAARQELTLFLSGYVDTVNSYIDAGVALWGKISNFSLTCTTANTDPQAPTVNPTATYAATPLSNDLATTNATVDSKLVKDLSDSKTQGLGSVGKVVGSINNTLSTKPPLEQREYVRLYSDINPIINPTIENLNYFKPTSENIGAAFLGYAPDKASLPLRKWGTDERLLRKNLKPKMNAVLTNDLQLSYLKLNTQFATNISNEFAIERKINPPNPLFATGYHIEGDSNYYNYHIRGPITLTILPTILNGVLGDRIGFINYLTPIKENITLTNEIYQVDNEGLPININKRGDKFIGPFKTINNSSITPTENE